VKLVLKKELLVGLTAVVLGLAAGAVFMAVTGNNPFEGYRYLFAGGLMTVERIGNTLATATPLILTGLSVAFAFRTGLFNIGASGQALVGGLVATILALSVGLPQALLLPMILVGAALAGALWAWLPGLLKARFNVHEVVSTIMMNWIAYWLTYYVVPSYFKGAFETESKIIPPAGSLKVDWLTQLTSGSFLNLGLVVALAAVVFVAVTLNNTVLGYRLKAVGFNRFAAEYAGINVNRHVVASMSISGALSGLGGATLYVGYATSLQIGVLPSVGFDGLAVAMLASNSPGGVLGAAVFFGILQSGKGFMNAMTKIPPEIGDTIIATIIYFAATSVLIERWFDWLSKRSARRREEARV
jgi:simple sugar transport system permease protein